MAKKRPVKRARGRFRSPLKGTYNFRLLRGGIVIAESKFENLITHAGWEYLASAGLANTPAVSATWHMGLINNAGSPALDLTDEMSSHAGWTEWTSYDEANRILVDWAAVGFGGASTLETDTTCDFTISASGTLYGAFIADENTKSGATGILFSEGGFSAPLNVVDNDVVQVGYTLSR